MKKLLTIVLTTTLISLPAMADTKTKKGGLKKVNQTLKSYDSNGDNKVTKSEYQNATKKFNFGDLDLNNDGTLSLGELAVQNKIDRRKQNDPTYEPDMTKLTKKATKIDRKAERRAERKASRGEGNQGGGKGINKGGNNPGKGASKSGNRGGGKGVGGGNRGGGKGGGGKGRK